MLRHGPRRLVRVVIPAVSAGALFVFFLSRELPSRSFGAVAVQAASQALGPVPDQHLVLPKSSSGAITIDYPEDGSIFPPEITPPTFIWRDDNAAAKAWRIDVTFADGAKSVHAQSLGDPMQVGEIDPRCISTTNKLPTLTPEQAAAHTWKPDDETWAFVKRHSLVHAASVSITGLDAANHPLDKGRVSISTSTDPVDGQIFYRDVPLMPGEGKKGIIQPLPPSMLYLINWRVRDIAKPESRIVMHDLHTCANCHSFSADGKTMGMDVDGPNNDKGLYAIVPVQPQMAIRNQDLVAWNTDRSVGQSRVGFMSQVSPDGQYVLSTFAGKDQTIPSSYFVTNFKDYRFLQVFYPTRGILAWYSRATGRREPLPGADDPRYVQTDGVWSPDGKYIVFARADAQDAYPPGHIAPTEANDPNEVQIKYSLYRVPFNNGLGGKPEPILGASNDGMSNSFPKISPDGKWIVFVKCRNAQLMRPDSLLYIVSPSGGVARRMKCNTWRMNSWHSFSPNGRWLVFSSKSRSYYTQMYLTHIDAKGNDSPPIYVDNSTAANRAVNLPEFVNIKADGLQHIDVPVSDFYRIIDEALELEKQGDSAAALLKWQKALEMNPDNAWANNGMGIALGLTGKPEGSIAYFQKATQLDGNFFEAYYNLGVVLAKENRVNDAIDAWQNTVRIHPKFAQGYENLGYALFEEGKFADAVAQLRLALADEPDRLFALNMAATLLAASPDDSVRNGAEAVAMADHAKQLSGGKSAAVLDTLAAAYAESGNFPQAIETDQQALALVTQEGNLAAAAKVQAHLAKYATNQPLRVPPDAVLF